MAFSPWANSWRSCGMASANIPWRVLTHSERAAPATRKRELSLSPLRSRSSVMAQEWSSVAQSQGAPSAEQMPCPYCVILTDVQQSSGSAATRPATTLVFPTLRECPPMTTIAIVPDCRSYPDVRRGMVDSLDQATPRWEPALSKAEGRRTTQPFHELMR